MKLSELREISLCPRCVSTEYVAPVQHPELVCVRCTGFVDSDGEPAWWTWHALDNMAYVVTVWTK